jgi:hypothetical protein
MSCCWREMLGNWELGHYLESLLFLLALILHNSIKVLPLLDRNNGKDDECITSGFVLTRLFKFVLLWFCVGIGTLRIAKHVIRWLGQ